VKESNPVPPKLTKSLRTEGLQQSRNWGDRCSMGM